MLAHRLSVEAPGQRTQIRGTNWYELACPIEIPATGQTSSEGAVAASRKDQHEDQRAFGLFGDMSVAGGIGRLPASGVSPYWQLRIEPSHCTLPLRQIVRLM